MKKTVWPSMKDVVEDMDKIRRDLHDAKTLIALLAWQQDDKTLHIPLVALEELPKGLELVISVDQIAREYVFKAVNNEYDGIGATEPKL